MAPSSAEARPDQPAGGFTMVPNDILEALASAPLSWPQVKALLFIIRRTLGWMTNVAGKPHTHDQVTASTVADATGFRKGTIRDALAALRRCGVLVSPPLVPGEPRVYGINLDIASWGCNDDTWREFQLRWQHIRRRGLFVHGRRSPRPHETSEDDGHGDERGGVLPVADRGTPSGARGYDSDGTGLLSRADGAPTVGVDQGTESLTPPGAPGSRKDKVETPTEKDDSAPATQGALLTVDARDEAGNPRSREEVARLPAEERAALAAAAAAIMPEEPEPKSGERKEDDPDQAVIRACWEAFGLDGAPREMSGRKWYGGLRILMHSKGRDIAYRWAAHLGRKHPSGVSIPDGAKPDLYFASEFRDALKAPFNWDRQEETFVVAAGRKVEYVPPPMPDDDPYASAREYREQQARNGRETLEQQH